jgi:hypothetical protein
VRIDSGIPDFVIEAVKDATELSLVHTQNALQAHAKVAVPNFVGVSGRDRRNEIGVDDATFHQVDSAVPVVVCKPVVGHNVGRAQSYLPQNVFAMDALVAEIVQRETNPWVAHAEVLIDFAKEHRHERGLPVMTMNNIGMLIRLEHEFERGPAEESESFNIIMMSIKDPAIEKVVVRMRIDEKTFQPFHEPEVNIAMNPLIVVWHPKIAVAFGQTPDAVVTHAIIFGENDLDRVTTNAKFSGQALDNIAEPADFCRRSAFGCDHYDEHGAEDVI